MKRTLAALAAIALALTIAGCSSTTSTPDTAAAADTVQDVTGMTGGDAQLALLKDGYLVKFATTDDSIVLLPSNWTVVSQDPAAGTPAKRGSTVTLTATKTKTDAPAPSATPAAPTTTPAGLTNGAAQIACDQYGDTQFPYGYKPHWLTGNIAQRIEGETWFMKIEATVKNQFNAKRDMTIECTVAGTDDSPTVASFNAY